MNEEVIYEKLKRCIQLTEDECLAVYVHTEFFKVLYDFVRESEECYPEHYRIIEVKGEKFFFTFHVDEDGRPRFDYSCNGREVKI